MVDKIRVSIVGGSGYTGGELIRLLSSHPQVEIVQIVSRSKAGKFVHSVNPNLRKSVLLKYCAPEELTECDVMFLCLPHGESMNSIHRYLDLSPKLLISVPIFDSTALRNIQSGTANSTLIQTCLSSSFMVFQNFTGTKLQKQITFPAQAVMQRQSFWQYCLSCGRSMWIRLSRR